MTIHTIEQLEGSIAEDIAWRKKELSEIKAIVQSTHTSTIRRTAMIRSGVAMLYAHWEGFIKNASQWYLEYVISCRLSYRQLSSSFVALAMKAQLNQALQANKASTFVPVCEFFLYNLDERCRLSIDGLVKTQSNLTSSALQEIMLSLGLDYTYYTTKSKFIDSKLVYARNIIAHGNYLLINEKDFLNEFDLVLGMIEYYRNQIENAAILRRFERANTKKPLGIGT
jgi:hypothetical protein